MRLSGSSHEKQCLQDKSPCSKLCTSRRTASRRRSLALEIRDGDEKSLTSVLAALSKRLNVTEFLEKPGFKFLIEKDRVDGQLVYRMRPELREAIKLLPALAKLRTAMAMSVNDIFERFKVERSWLVLP